MIRGSNLSADPGVRLEESELVYLPADFAERFPRSIARSGDLVFTCWGTVGQVGHIGESSTHSEYLISNKQMKATLDSNIVDPVYVYYYLSQPSMVAYIRDQAIGSSVPGFNLGQMKELEIEIPPRAVQAGIALVLGALDDKIASNGVVVASAESLRRTAWGRAARESRLAPLASFAQFVNGGAYTKGATGSGRVVIRIAELNSGIGASTVYNDLDVPDRQVAHAGDLLMSWSGSLTAVRWYREDGIVNQHIFKVIPRDSLPVWAVACAVETKLDEFREIAAGKATTMGHIKRADLDSPVAWPEISDRLNDAGQALWDRALMAEQENLRLAATRDELLPLLMSGKITVKDAEKTVEEVV